MHRARELAQALQQNSPTSLASTKRLLSGYAFGDLNTQIHAAVDENAKIRTTADFREGLNAFLEKRKPNWQG